VFLAKFTNYLLVYDVTPYNGKSAIHAKIMDNQINLLHVFRRKR